MTHSIELDPVTEQRLDELVARTGRTKSDQLHELILNALEDAQDLEAAEREWKAVQAGTSKPIPLEEVLKSYGMGS